MHPSVSKSDLAAQNDLIDRLAACIRVFGGDNDVSPSPEDELITFARGHSGEGWYLSCGSYPDEGAEFIGPLEYGALMVAQAIVAEERAAGVEVTRSPEYQAQQTSSGATAAETVSKSEGAGGESSTRLPRSRDLVASAPDLSVQSPAVVFQAQMVAMGAADVLAEDLAAHGDATVLVFKTEVEEARRAAPLFRKKASLTAIEVG